MPLTFHIAVYIHMCIYVALWGLMLLGVLGASWNWRSVSFPRIGNFAWNVPLVSLIFLKRSLVFPFYCFPLFLCIDCWGGLYLSLLFFETLHLNGYIFPFLLCLSLLFSGNGKASTDNHFAFLHFFILGKVLIIASCTILWTSIHSSSETLSIRSNPLNPFVTSLYNPKGFGLGHIWMA